MTLGTHDPFAFQAKLDPSFAVNNATVRMESEISFGSQELRNVVSVLYNGGNILL